MHLKTIKMVSQASLQKEGKKSVILPTSLVVQMVKCLSAMQETQVRSLGWEDPLEKEMAGHSSILAWKIPWTAEPGRLQSMGLLGVGQTERLHFICKEVYK